MRYFSLQFGSHPAEEGDDFQYIQSAKCGQCGASVPPAASKFAVPEDRVQHVHAGLWEKPSLPLFEIAGLLAVEVPLAEELTQAGLTGVSLAPMEATYLEEDQPGALPRYLWARVHGRCFTNDVWTRVVKSCPACGNVRVEPVERAVRTVGLKAPPPNADFCRAREDAVGIVVSDKAKAFFENRIPNLHQQLQFKAIGDDESLDQ